MNFEQWFLAYAPTAPECLDDCAKAAWNAALEAAASKCEEIGNYEVPPDEYAEAIRAMKEE